VLSLFFVIASEAWRSAFFPVIASEAWRSACLPVIASLRSDLPPGLDIHFSSCALDYRQVATLAGARSQRQTSFILSAAKDPAFSRHRELAKRSPSRTGHSLLLLHAGLQAGCRARWRSLATTNFFHPERSEGSCFFPSSRACEAISLQDWTFTFTPARWITGRLPRSLALARNDTFVSS